MNQSGIIKLCKDLGCCNACCLRYLGLKNPNAYENPSEFLGNLYSRSTDSEANTTPPKDEPDSSTTEHKVENNISAEQGDGKSANDGDSENKDDGPAAKRPKTEGICTSCMGLLEEGTWAESYTMVKEMLDKKCYECDTFACALSAPIATILREKAITLYIKEKFTDYDPKCVTPLKEAWKWSFATKLAVQIGKTLDSGAVSPLLITLNMEYSEDLQELEILKTLSPNLFETRSQQRRRFTVEFTRRSVEQALEGATLTAMVKLDGWSRGIPVVGTRAKCVSVVCTHSPLYLAGRYIKLSRELPQTPWVLNGERMMESSVQEIIFQPIADVYKMTSEDMEYRLKFMAAGREDVDVRCLGDGRPFAIEINDPRRELTKEELTKICEEISRDKKVVVNNMVHITRDDLTQLKKGEETKCKTYEALCIKLTHSQDDDITANGDTPVVVTEKDIENINKYRNTEDKDSRIVLSQKTPIRVLHRRSLLTRTRKIMELNAQRVPDHPQLLTVHVVTEAGTYIKEWVHGEARRTKPSLGDAIGAKLDILALDVASVHLIWPPGNVVSKA